MDVAAETATRRILPLSSLVASQISSTKDIATFTTAVLGLLENSLDAESSKVEIMINWVRRGCVVEDNGHGIDLHEFGSTGGLLKRHHTSKVSSYACGGVHSCHGTFLASLATLSHICITSRGFLSAHHGEVLSRGPIPIEHESGMGGTRVCFNDLFGNMPVRAKQYALLLDERAKARQFESLKHDIVALSLAWSRPCSVWIRDGTRSVKLSAAHPSISNALTARALNGKQRYSLLDKLPLLVQAGLANPAIGKHWIPISASNSRYIVKGMINLMPVLSTTCQFISLGIVPLQIHGEHNILYSSINALFDNSSFGNNNESHPHDVNHGHQKGPDKRPMYILQVKARTAHEDCNIRHVNDLLSLLSEIISHWLSAHDFKPRQRRKRSEMQSAPAPVLTQAADLTSANPSQGLPRRKRRAVDLDLITGETVLRQASVPTTRRELSWTRMKSSEMMMPSGMRKHTDLRSAESAVASDALTPRTPSPPTQRTQEESFIDAAGNQYVRWQDPINKKEVYVDLRTGTTLTRSAYRHLMSEGVSPSCHATTCQIQPQEPRLQLPSHLKEWTPAVFAAPHEESIPTAAVYDALTNVLHSEHGLLCQHNAATHHLSKASLTQARVIAQVDTKFILCTLSETPQKQCLVMIDQHAASERVLLEQLLESLCTSQPTILETPLVFEIPEQEATLLARKKDDFAYWAIYYDVSSTQPEMSASKVRQSPCQHRVTISALPDAIAERCRTTPRVLIELLRSEAWSISKNRPPSDRPLSWLERIHQCPKGILDLLNSRACRSAIMFNDELSDQECWHLVSQLSHTVFPFMCAHGRTSIVPVIELDTTESEEYTPHGFNERHDETASFVAAYHDWIS